MKAAGRPGRDADPQRCQIVADRFASLEAKARSRPKCKRSPSYETMSMRLSCKDSQTRR